MRIAGSYEVLGELGRGGTGVVYRARTVDGREVAVKLLHQGWDPRTSAAFDRELRLLWSFSQVDGFVPVLDSGSDRGRPYLVMPFLEGGTLRRRLRGGRLPVAEAVALVARLAQTMARAHERGIVHRDLKPENVIFDAAGVPFVADLGLAKHFRRDVLGGTESGTVSGAGLLAGTPGYMAPEQLQDAGKARPQADVFALGAILHEALTGQPPFGGKDPLGYGLDLLGMTPVAPSRVRAEVPRWLDAVVARALEKEEAARYSDAGELARALGGTGPRGRRRWVAAVAVVGLLAAGLPGAILVSRPGETGDLAAVTSRYGGTGTTTRPQAKPPEPPGAKKADKAPEFVSDCYARGCERERVGDLDGALVDMTRAVELDPGFATAWAERAMIRFSMGDRPGALEDASKAIELAPGSGQAWGVLGHVRCRGLNMTTVDLAEGIADLDSAVVLEPKVAWLWNDRAAARGMSGDLEGAISDASKAIELDSTDVRFWQTRGTARLTKGDADGAIADTTRALELDPTLAVPWLDRATARSAKGEVEGAISDLERFLSLDPEGPMSPIARSTLAELRARAAAR